MDKYRTKYELFYTEAVDLIINGKTTTAAYEYINSLQGEDYRDHTFLKVARLLASEGRIEDALGFCAAIHDKLERADALFEVARELRKRELLDSAKDAFRQAVNAAAAIDPGAWEVPAILLQVSEELWNLNEKAEAVALLHRAIGIAERPPQYFEASKTLAGCARLLSKWDHRDEAVEVAKKIQSPEQRKLILEELGERSL